MFDANMRYVAKGKEFFAEVNAVRTFGKLYSAGYREGDVILCKMLSKGHENPAVMVGNLQFTNNEEYMETLLIYAGRTDGSGFIDDTVRNKALQVLDGKWRAGNV